MVCRAGSGTAKNVQDVADAAVTNARSNLNKAKASFGDLMGTGEQRDYVTPLLVSL